MTARDAETGRDTVRIGVIGGTNAELALEGVEESSVGTPWGCVAVLLGTPRGAAPGREAAFVRRHGEGHRAVSSRVRHRANVWALREVGASAIVGTTVCGVIDTGIGLARPIVFDDLYFPDNRLPDGSPCTFLDEEGASGRGHFIFDRPFSPSLRRCLLDACTTAGLDAMDRGTYAHVLGPRFNSRAEIAALRAAGASAVSQTAGPEAILAGELELPYALLGFGVDYANGVTAEPTPVEVLERNIAAGVGALETILTAAVSTYEPGAFDTGFVYRFD